ncbi:conserved protein of unknown function [Streptococcus thermophilus]|uniref:Uncharacterized protein n=1 Tax=Streptococcus thermophilus TaxID=1308 RepID=A0A8D6U844_STRTR|nr:hypothetical protein [Streptococcus thermophilus]CAD0145830.1 conserved protein of unknown function [Streptococcus thermophilus]CAD0152880.1 conserved protein of unknown function [Streptococcus thermophilus]
MSNKSTIKEKVILFLVERMSLTYQVGLDVVNELEKFELVKFDKDEGFSLKELSDNRPQYSNSDYYMPKVLMKDALYKEMEVEAKFAYAVLLSENADKGGLK